MKYLLNYNTYISEYNTVIELRNLKYSILNSNSIYENILNNLYIDDCNLVYENLNINEGISDFLTNIKNSAKNVGTKIYDISKKVIDIGSKTVDIILSIVTATLKEFDKSYNFFTTNAKKDAKVAATWTLKKYPYIARASEKSTKSELTWFDNVSEWYHKTIENFKEKFRSTFIKSVEDGIDKTKDIKIDESNIETLKLKTKEISKKFKNNLDKELVRKRKEGTIKKEVSFDELTDFSDYSFSYKWVGGYVGKVFGFCFPYVMNAINHVVDVMDVFTKNFALMSLDMYSTVIEKCSGIKKPRTKFNNTAVIYTHAGIHSQGGVLSGGMFKNWKKALGVGIREAIKWTLRKTMFVVNPITALISTVISTLIVILENAKKVWVTNLIIKISAKRISKSHVKKIETTMLSGGIKNFFSKNVE